MDDGKIIGLFFERDERAIAETKAKYGKYVFAIAQNVIENREDAEECASDVYLSLWKSIPPQRPENLKAFIGKVARNVALSKLDYVRAEKRGANMTVLLSEIEDILPSGDEIDDGLGKEAVAKATDSGKKPSQRRSIHFSRRCRQKAGGFSCAGTSSATR